MTLLEACRYFAISDEWEVYESASGLGRDALDREWSDDFDDCALSSVNITDRPYIDPRAACQYIRAQSLERTLVDRALSRLQKTYWVAVARRSQDVKDEIVSHDLLFGLRLAIEAEVLDVEGVEYYSLRFQAPSARKISELVDLVTRISPRMDPAFHLAMDFREEVRIVTGIQFPEATILDAMKQAGLDSGFFKPGRRTGRPGVLNREK